jgi:lysophospholipase L1-like esterase
MSELQVKRTLKAVSAAFLLWLSLASFGFAQRPTSITVLGDDAAIQVEPGVSAWPDLLESPYNYIMLPIITDLSRPELTTEMVLETMRSGSFDWEQDCFVIQLGLADSFVDLRNGKKEPRVTRTQFAENLQEIVSTLRSKWEQCQIILLTPNPLRWTNALKEELSHPPYDIYDPLGLDHLVSVYSTEIRRIAVQNKLALVDVHRILGRRDRFPGCSAGEYLSDGIHLNSMGHEAVHLLVIRAVAFYDNFLPGVSPTFMPVWTARNLWAGRPDFSIPVVDISRHACLQSSSSLSAETNDDLIPSAPFHSRDGTKTVTFDVEADPMSPVRAALTPGKSGARWEMPYLPGSLSGRGHLAAEAPCGRLVVVFQDTSPVSPTLGSFVAWVGTWENLRDGEEGEYRIKLLDHKGWAGAKLSKLIIKPDGVIVVSAMGKSPGDESFTEKMVQFTLEETDSLVEKPWERR